MTRDYESLRDDAIRTRTERLFTAKLADLVCGTPELVARVDDALSHELCRPENAHRLIVLAVTDKRQAGAVLEQLIHKVLRDAAEVEATKEVEQIEKQREQEAAEARAEQVAWDRAERCAMGGR